MRAYGLYLIVLSWLAAACGEDTTNTDFPDSVAPSGAHIFTTAAEFASVEMPSAALCSAGEVAVALSSAQQSAGFAFGAEAGQRARLQLESPALAMSVALYGPKLPSGMYGDGTALAYSGPPSKSASIEFTLTTDGLYLAVVSAAGGLGSANLRLFINLAPGCPGAEDCNDNDPCTVDSRVSGACSNQPIPGCGGVCTTDEDCDDGNACTDTPCLQGRDGLSYCGLAPRNCDDNNPCTEDGCKSEVGCTHTPLATPECALSGCQADAECDDGVPCTLDTCANGACSYTLSPEPACNPESCDDGDVCTVDIATEEGDCTHLPILGCGGPAPCTTASDCNDSNACTVDSCGAAGTCAHTPVECSDDDPCTVDACQPSSGCVFPPSPTPECQGECAQASDCDDGDTCTINGCVDAKCVSAPSMSPECQPAACDDGNPCTLDTEGPGGCEFTAIPGCQAKPCSTSAECDDSNACTDDACTSGSGGSFCSNTPKTCNDNNACTIDSCGTATGCIFASTSGACDDGDPCTTGDFCLAGVCEPGPNGCGEPDLVACALHGPSGAERICPLRLASTVNNPAKMAAAMQLTLKWNHAAAKIVEIYDELCFAGAGCFDLPVALAPGAQSLSSGHSVSAAPMNLGDWNKEGFGAMVIVHLGDPGALLSPATVNAQSQVSGDPVVLRMRFEMLQQVPQGAPVTVAFNQVVAADPSSLALKLSPLGKPIGILVTEP